MTALVIGVFIAIVLNLFFDIWFLVIIFQYRRFLTVSFFMVYVQNNFYKMLI